MKYTRIIKLPFLLLFSALTCHAQTTMTLTDNGDGTWSLDKMPSYNVKMVVEYENITHTLADNGDGTWSLDKIPPYNVKMVVEYENITHTLADNDDGTWSLDKMPPYNVKMVVEYEDVDIPAPTTCVFADNGDGTWSLDKMPPYNVKMVVEYEYVDVPVLADNGDGTWSLDKMPPYNVKMLVEYEDLIPTLADNGDGTWSLDKMPPYNVRMVVEYVDEQFDITANSDGKGNYWATYYNENAGYSADVNTMVYTATMSANKQKVILKEVDDRVIPAGNAVILKSADANVTMTYKASATGTFAGNELKGSATAVTTPENTYMLVKGANGVGFYHWKGANIPAGKAYLIMNTGAALAREFFPFAEETATDIDVVSAEDDDNDGLFYDLTGRMVAKKPSASGIYIKDGKKVVIK